MSEFRIGDYNYVFDSTVGLTASSADSEFPVSNLRNFHRSKVWRTSGTFVITAGSNDKINFKEAGGGLELTATLTPGTYTASGLAAEIKTALEAAGAETYTVSQSSTTGKWTISHAGAFLSLLWSTGTNAATSVGSTLGFDTSADDTGATSYTGANIAIHTEESIVIDLRTAEEIDSFAMIFDPTIGSKLTTDAVVRLQANATDNWSAPAVDQVVTYDEDYDLFTHFFSAAQEYRYWRLKIVDPENPNLYVEIPKLFLTKATQLSQVPQSGFTMRRKDRSRKDRTDYGHVYCDLYPILRTLEFKYGVLPAADVKLLEDVFERVGSTTPVFVALDPTATLFDKDRFFLYGYLRDELGLGHVFNEYFDSGLTVEEAL